MKIISKIQSIFLYFFAFKRKDYTKLYSVERKSLGSGGNAIVKIATKNKDNQKVAIKILKNDAKLSNEKVLRFKDEIKIMSENAPIIDGIMPILDYSVLNCWYTMPIAEDIKKHMANGNNHIEEIVDGIIEVAETLIKLHNKELSHRDIKPDNIFFFNNRYYLGDFGLVDIPNNPNNLTENGDRIGAKYTIAPEMIKNAKTADGKKADVYSLAKTLWMLLKEDYKGFDGRYDFTDSSISLHHYAKLSKTHIVEIDELLVESTKNSPEERPSMVEFRDKLTTWKDTYQNREKIQRSNWCFINKYIFTNTQPASCSWTDIDSIVKVLNIISNLPAYNYMIFSDRGGLDFQSAEKANEKGCIYIYATNILFLVKPKRLYLEVFDDSDWNYFLLELEHQRPILGNMVGSEEYLVEDIPAHYVSAQYAQYGVYDYDSGEAFPEGYKVVHRYIDGKFLIVLKQGFYNSITSVTDGRHGDCSSSEFRDYMDKIIDISTKATINGYDIEAVLNHYFNYNPFKKAEMFLTHESCRGKCISSEFIKENYSGFNFKKIIDKSTLKEDSKIRFYYKFNFDIEVNFSSIFSSENLYLCKDGYIRLLTENDENIFMVYDRDSAIKFSIHLEEELAKLCQADASDRVWASFDILLQRIGVPTHLFTKDEIKKLMRDADDRKDNILVIDEDGYARIINRHNESSFYPLRHETWCAGNVYVGKYSRLSDLNDTYQYSLYKWLEYLETDKKAAFEDYVSYSKCEAELIAKIKEFYNHI